MTNEEVEFTKTWWRGILSDAPKLIALLQKWEYLHRSNYDWWYRWTRVTATTRGTEYNSIIVIRDNEITISGLYYELLGKHRIARKTRGTAPYSRYINELKIHPNTVHEAFALQLIVDRTASNRLGVLTQMPETPSDIICLFNEVIEKLRNIDAVCLPHLTQENLTLMDSFHKPLLNQLFKRERDEPMRDLRVSDFLRERSSAPAIGEPA